jgi:hypothetical protein
MHLRVCDNPMVDCITVCMGTEGLYAHLVISFSLLNEMFEKKELSFISGPKLQF